jgi:hypothetical protein
MMNHKSMGATYGASMTPAERIKAVSARVSQRVGTKTVVGIAVGPTYGRKMLYMSAAEFKDFESGFVGATA